MKFIKFVSIFILVIAIYSSCKKPDLSSETNKEIISDKNLLVSFANSLFSNLSNSSNRIQAELPGSTSATIPFHLDGDSLAGVLGKKNPSWIYDNPNSPTLPTLKTGISIRNGFLVEEVPYILGDKLKIDSFKVKRRGYMEFENDFSWIFEFTNSDLLHSYTVRIKKHNAPKHARSSKLILVSFTDKGVSKYKTIQWYQNAPFFVPLIYNKGMNSFFTNIVSSGVLIGSSTSSDIKNLNEYGIPATWRSDQSEFWFTFKDSTYHYQTERDYGLSDLYQVNNVNRRHTIYQKRKAVYENLTSGTKVILRDSTYSLYNDLLKQPAYYSYQGLGFAGVTEIKIFEKKSTIPSTQYIFDRGAKLVSFSPGMKIEETIKKYDYFTNKTDTVKRTVVFN
jgi:hypothetical protein